MFAEEETSSGKETTMDQEEYGNIYAEGLNIAFCMILLSRCYFYLLDFNEAVLDHVQKLDYKPIGGEKGSHLITCSANIE